MSGGRGGRRVGAGRPKGRVAQETADIKAMVIGALQDVGGRDWLAARAQDQPVAFMSLVGRVLPHQVTGENGAPIAVDFRWADALPATLAGPVIDADETISVTFATTNVGEC
jgi:hypothetical protein